MKRQNQFNINGWLNIAKNIGQLSTGKIALSKKVGDKYESLLVPVQCSLSLADLTTLKGQRVQIWGYLSGNYSEKTSKGYYCVVITGIKVIKAGEKGDNSFSLTTIVQNQKNLQSGATVGSIGVSFKHNDAYQYANINVQVKSGINIKDKEVLTIQGFPTWDQFTPRGATNPVKVLKLLIMKTETFTANAGSDTPSGDVPTTATANEVDSDDDEIPF